jgi:glycosyltransferase involved in cell wall biosynthesis
MQQDFPHELVEIVFVDDGSVDETFSIITSYVAKMDMKVKVFHHEWRGLGPSRNVVVDNANGSYIIWVDGDMMLPKDHVRKQVEFIDQNPMIGIAKAKMGVLDEENFVGFLESIGYVAADHIYGGRPTSRALGTGGAIYRVDAVRQIGGFDASIKGGGEDIDAESRVRKAGWLLYLGSPAVFYEHHRSSLKSIWDEGFWWGHGASRVFWKNKKMFALHKMNPIASLLAGAWYATVAYKVTHRKTVFLLSFQYALKMLAWCLGFIKGQMDGYHHTDA